MRVAILGANGQLGSDLRQAFTEAGHSVAALTHAEVEIDDPHSVERALAAARPDVIVNAAAFVNVDQCEQEPERAMAINAAGAAHVAEFAGAKDRLLVQISTDYVFSGDKRSPYAETDATGPLNVYGASKLAGEKQVAERARRHVIVRLSGLYGRAPCRGKAGLNFVTRMLQIGRERVEARVVDDEVIAPTHTLDAARQIALLLPADRYGVYHAASQGGCSWHDFAAKIFELAGLKVRLSVARSSEFPAKAKRPVYSVLDNAALRAAGLERMPTWPDALAGYLKAIL
jgi:dTDP-4-dehydrorhamnose reductase